MLCVKGLICMIYDFFRRASGGAKCEKFRKPKWIVKRCWLPTEFFVGRLEIGFPYRFLPGAEQGPENSENESHGKSSGGSHKTKRY